MAVIPPELYRPILECIETGSDLYSCLFISRMFGVEAERCLYRSFTARPPSIGPDKQDEIILQIPYSPQFIQHLVHLDLRTFWSHAVRYERARDWMDRLSTFSNLKTLHLPISPEFLPVANSSFRLHSFSHQVPLTQYNQMTCLFLDAQLDICELELPTDVGAHLLRSLSPRSLPKLRILHASASACHFLIQGRNVRCVNVKEGTLPVPIPGSESLRRIVLHRFNILRQFASCFATLEFLRFPAVRGHREHFIHN